MRRKKNKTPLKTKIIMFLIVAAFMSIYVLNEAVSSNIKSSESTLNEAALDYLGEKYAFNSAYKDRYVSISEWTVLNNSLAQSILEAREKEVEQLSEDVVNKTAKLVDSRQNFRDFSIQTSEVMGKLTQADLPEEVVNLVQQYYNTQLKIYDKEVENLSSSLISTSNKFEEMNKNGIDFPKEIAYAIVDISFGGKILGQKNSSYPIFINIANNEVLSIYKHENDYTAIKQVVLASPSRTSHSNKIAILLLGGTLVFFGLMINKDRKTANMTWKEWFVCFTNPTTGELKQTEAILENQFVFEIIEEQRNEI